MLTVIVSITNCCDVMGCFLQIMHEIRRFLDVASFVLNALSCALDTVQMFSGPLCSHLCTQIKTKQTNKQINNT